ncbi:MAG: pyridoxal phosphate-dependent aminotransferase, partial [Thermoplasmatota archaeon]
MVARENKSRPALSRRVAMTHPPIMQSVKALARGRDVIDLSQGVPYFDPPEDAVRRGIDDLKGSHRYGPDGGDEDLLDELRIRLSRRYGTVCDPALNLMVTPGANMGFFSVIATICDPGDEVVLLDPYYFNHRMALDILGIDAVHVRTDESFHPVPDLIEERFTPRTRAVVLVSPNNPTGAVYTEGDVRRIFDMCSERGIFLITDETYEDFVYEGEHFSGASLFDDDLPVVSLFSLSKAYGISGWRVGYALFPRRMHDGLLKVQDTAVICPTRISQRVACHMLRMHPDPLHDQIKYLGGSRSLVNDFIDRMNDVLTAPSTDGAFYSFPGFLGGTGIDSMGVVKRILDGTSVLTVPGGPFGFDDPPFFRISFGNVERSDLEEALARL